MTAIALYLNGGHTQHLSTVEQARHILTLRGKTNRGQTVVFSLRRPIPLPLNVNAIALEVSKKGQVKLTNPIGVEYYGKDHHWHRLMTIPTRRRGQQRLFVLPEGIKELHGLRVVLFRQNQVFNHQISVHLVKSSQANGLIVTPDQALQPVSFHKLAHFSSGRKYVSKSPDQLKLSVAQSGHELAFGLSMDCRQASSLFIHPQQITEHLRVNQLLSAEQEIPLAALRFGDSFVHYFDINHIYKGTVEFRFVTARPTITNLSAWILTPAGI